MSIGLSVAALAMTSSGQQPRDPSEKSVPLTELIEAFHKNQDAEPELPRVTVDEVTAAIRASLSAERANESGLSPSVLRDFANKKALPEGSLLELETYVDPGGEFVFDVRDISLRIPTKMGGQTGIPIRKRLIASRTLAEEIARVERELKSAPPLPGRYRLDDRLRALKERTTSIRKTE